MRSAECLNPCCIPLQASACGVNENPVKPPPDLVPMLCCRLRLHAPGQSGPLSIGVEVLDVVQGIYMVEVVKGRGASPDFYAFYSQLTEQLQVGADSFFMHGLRVHADLLE